MPPQTEIKLLKKKLEEARMKNVKLMWQYANWEYRIIIIIGYLAIIYLGWKIGRYLFL